MKVGSCLITSDRTAAYTGMSSALVSHWRTLTISVSCAPAAASASATLRQASTLVPIHSRLLARRA